MPLFGHSVGTYPETSSQAVCQETFGHSRHSLLSHCGLILAERVEVVRASFKKKKKAQAGNEWSNIVPTSPQARKKKATTISSMLYPCAWTDVVDFTSVNLHRRRVLKCLFT